MSDAANYVKEKFQDMDLLPPPNDKELADRARANSRKAMTPKERERADKVTNKLNLISQELDNASNLFRQGRKTDAALLYVTCGEALQKLADECKDDPLFVQALKTRVKDCVWRADICRRGKPITEVEPGIDVGP